MSAPVESATSEPAEENMPVQETASRSSALPSVAGQVISDILTQGSSLNPLFLQIIDAAFILLLLVFVACLILTRSFHFVALILIELGLWGSVKLYVDELRKDNERLAAEKKSE